MSRKDREKAAPAAEPPKPAFGDTMADEAMTEASDAWAEPAEPPKPEPESVGLAISVSPPPEAPPAPAAETPPQEAKPKAKQLGHTVCRITGTNVIYRGKLVEVDTVDEFSDDVVLQMPDVFVSLE